MSQALGHKGKTDRKKHEFNSGQGKVEKPRGVHGYSREIQ
jgi:hypothetical protein